MTKNRNRWHYNQRCKKPFENEKEIYGNTTEDVRNLFRLEKEIDDNTIKYIRNIYRLKERKGSNQKENNQRD